MTPKQAEMVAFLRRQYDDSLQTARDIERVVASEGIPGINVAPDRAESLGRVHAAESRIRFLDATVVPYLGRIGETGRIADEQLWHLVDERRGAAGYDESWRLRPLS